MGPHIGTEEWLQVCTGIVSSNKNGIQSVQSTSDKRVSGAWACNLSTNAPFSISEIVRVQWMTLQVKIFHVDNYLLFGLGTFYLILQQLCQIFWLRHNGIWSSSISTLIPCSNCIKVSFSKYYCSTYLHSSNDVNEWNISGCSIFCFAVVPITVLHSFCYRFKWNLGHSIGYITHSSHLTLQFAIIYI